MEKALKNPIVVSVIFLFGCLLILGVARQKNLFGGLNSTPTIPPTFDAKISQPDFCHNGPNDNYGGAFIIAAETHVKVLGMAIEGDWFMIQGDGFGPCWIKASALTLPNNLDIGKLLNFVTAITLENIPCYTAPDTTSEAQTFIPANWRVVAYGKNNKMADWVLIVPHDSTEFCWVQNNALSGFVNVNLPVEPADIAFSPTPTITVTPTHTLTLTSTPTFTQTPIATKTFIYVPPTSTPTRKNSDGNDTPIPPPATLPNGQPSNTPGLPASNTPVPPTPIPPTKTPVPPTPIPSNTPVPPTPTLCWPPGHCK